MTKTQPKTEAEKLKKEILYQKIRDSSYRRTNMLNPFVRDYCYNLYCKFAEFECDQRNTADDGFKRKTLSAKIKYLSKIKSQIDEIADIGNPNHPHIGIAKEMAEENFDTIMGIFTPILDREDRKYSFV